MLDWTEVGGGDLSAPIENVADFSVSPHNKRFVITTRDGLAIVHPFGSDKHQSVSILGEAFAAAHFSSHGGYVVTTGRDKTVRFWDPESGLPVWEPIRMRDEITSIAVSPDGERLLVGTNRDAFLFPLPLSRYSSQRSSIMAEVSKRLTQFGPGQGRLLEPRVPTGER